MRRQSIRTRIPSRSLSKKTSSENCAADSLTAGLKDIPDVRQARVDQLRRAVADGTYTISPDRIAQAMLDSGLNLGFG